jgi:hypothetical protein
MMPPVSSAHHHFRQVAATDLNTGYSTAISSHVFNGDSDTTSTNDPACCSRSSGPIGLRGLRGIDAEETDSDLSTDRAANVKRVSICDLHHLSGEGLSRFYLGGCWGSEEGKKESSNRWR